MEGNSSGRRDMKKRSNILVVDDEEVIRRGYARTLTGADCDVATAWNGKEALDALEHRPYDVVLLDLRMPEMDGMTVLRTIKEKWPESEVVVITGYPSIETAKEAVRLGACDYLAKPVAPDEVINATHGALKRKHWTLRSQAASGASHFESRAHASPA
jgi:DNA-binding NtrC family response regulator